MLRLTLVLAAFLFLVILAWPAAADATPTPVVLPTPPVGCWWPVGDLLVHCADCAVTVAYQGLVPPDVPSVWTQNVKTVGAMQLYGGLWRITTVVTMTEEVVVSAGDMVEIAP